MDFEDYNDIYEQIFKILLQVRDFKSALDIFPVLIRYTSLQVYVEKYYHFE